MWRAQKYLAAAGLGSRRKCEALIVAGRVTVDGQPATLGTKVDPDAGRVEVDGSAVNVPARKYYVALNKPSGYLVAKSDARGRSTVMDLLLSLPYAALLNPVGRLDSETEGLLLLTNDGELAHRLTHPSYEVKKTYEVITSKQPTGEQLQALRQGFVLDGRTTAPAEADVIGKRRAVRSNAGGRTWTVRLTIHEGRNRQVRRMFKHLGLPVLALRRTAIGPVCLGSLPRGAHRDLRKEDISMLERAVGLP